MERACVTARGGVIRPENLPSDLLPAAGPGQGARCTSTWRGRSPSSFGELTAAFEERYLRRALRKARGHVGRCAKISGLSRRSVSAKIAQYKIDTAAYKPK